MNSFFTIMQSPFVVFRLQQQRPLLQLLYSPTAVSLRKKRL